MSNVLRLIEQINPDRHLLPEQRERLSDLTEDFFRRYARLGRPSPAILLALNSVSSDGRAEQLYFESLVCLGQEDAESFYRAFPTARLSVTEWDDTRPITEARADAAGRLSAANKECTKWQG